VTRIAHIRSHGKAKVRRHLEGLVNRGQITVLAARHVYRDAFGGDLYALPEEHKRRHLGEAIVYTLLFAASFALALLAMGAAL
jgi:hypothetical protein